MARRAPSGDHESGDDGALGGRLAGSVHGAGGQPPRRALPSAEISQTCAGRGASSSR